MINWIEISSTRIRITGRDRLQVLHNFCTADVRRMNAGDCREAMVLNLKGKLLGHVWLVHWGDWMELITVPNQAPSLIAHFQQFVIREQVEFHDESTHSQTLWFFSTNSDQPDPSHSPPLLAAAMPPFLSNAIVSIPPNRATQLDWESQSIPMVQSDFAGPGWLLRVPHQAMDSLRQELLTGNVHAATPGELTAHRITNRVPWYDIDADQDSLPQELDRDSQAISFEKGCYLGQETVARIDALGKVNRKLVRLRTQIAKSSAQPSDQESILESLQLPMVLNCNGVEAGRMTSIARDPHGSDWIGLAMIKRTMTKTDTVLTGEGRDWWVW